MKTQRQEGPRPGDRGHRSAVSTVTAGAGTLAPRGYATGAGGPRGGAVQRTQPVRN